MGLKLEIKDGYYRYIEPEITDWEYKGKSIIEIPDDYTVIDIETTGYDCVYDSIIEISALRVRDKQAVDSFSSLVKPTKFFEFGSYDKRADEDDYYDDSSPAFRHLSSTTGYYYVLDFITKLTGITIEMLDDAPEPRDVIPEFLSFVGNDILVGHNTNFDINFLYDAALSENCGTLKNNFVDTLRFSRKLFPDMDHHRLSDTAAKCAVSYENAHRALSDCKITFECFEKMKSIISERYSDISQFKRLFRYVGKRIDCSTITAQTGEFDEDHPFYNKTVVFTGDLGTMSRKEAMQLVVNVGGLISDNVTRKTNYLVVGSFDFIKSVKGNKSTKMKKAEELILGGYDLKIISDKTFFELI